MDLESCGRRVEAGKEGANLGVPSEAVKDPASLD